MWALTMCSLSTHDEPCLLPRRSPWRALHLLTSNPRRTLPCTTEKPLAASPHLLTFNPRRSLPSRTAMPLAVPLHRLTFNPRRSLPSPNDEAIRPLNSCSLSRPSTCSTFAQVMRPLGASLQGTASPASGRRCGKHSCGATLLRHLRLTSNNVSEREKGFTFCERRS